MTQPPREMDATDSPISCTKGKRGECEVSGPQPQPPPRFPHSHDESAPDSAFASLPSPTRAALITAGAARLRVADTDSPRLEARLLLAQALSLSPTALLRDPTDPVSPAAQARYETLLARRAGHEPLAFLLGHREFWSLDLAVSPVTLIPRPDSETLIEAARTAFAGRPPPRRVLDLGTGTGCLLLAALTEFPAAFGVGIDRVPAAARLAAANATALGLASRAAFLCADWSAALHAQFDLILCNPPYIPTSTVKVLMPDVAEHEPRSALDGGPDGLAAYRAIIPQLWPCLSPDGVAIFELGIDQVSAVRQIARSSGFAADCQPDLAGVPRALLLTEALP